MRAPPSVTLAVRAVFSGFLGLRLGYGFRPEMLSALSSPVGLALIVSGAGISFVSGRRRRARLLAGCPIGRGLTTASLKPGDRTYCASTARAISHPSRLDGRSVMFGSGRSPPSFMVTGSSAATVVGRGEHRAEPLGEVVGALKKSCICT